MSRGEGDTLASITEFLKKKPWQNFTDSRAARIILHSCEEGGYWVECPDYPGCVSQGDTVEEAREMILDALNMIYPNCFTHVVAYGSGFFGWEDF
jgi:predicted RNase H-like HicB family nuclease